MLKSSTRLQNRSFHVVVGIRTAAKSTKVKNVHEKRLQVTFWTVKYANKQIAISIVGSWASFLSPNSDVLELMQSCIDRKSVV